MNSMVCAAIHDRSVIEFIYKNRTRIVEPYCHGVSQAGNEVLRAFQIGGDSDSGNPVGWKLYEMSRMSVLRTTGASFVGPRPGYNPNDTQMTLIHCRV